MSTSTDATTDPPDTTGTTAGATTATEMENAAELDKWKAMSRKMEKAASDAQAELDRMKASSMSDAEKAADQARQSEARFTALEAKVKRQSIALEHKLTADDAALLDDITDETAMRNLAKRLAGAADSDRRTNGNKVPAEGRTTGKAGVDPVRELTRNLFGRDD